MVLDCAWIDGCTAVVTDRTLDLRPTNGTVDRYPGGGGAGDCAGIVWADCEVPAGDYDRLSVWGEDLAVPCFGGDMDDCEAPTAFSPRANRCPRAARSTRCRPSRSAVPSEIQSWSRETTTPVEHLRLPLRVVSGRLPRVAEGRGTGVRGACRSCSRCGDEDVCVSQDTICSVYDPPPDAQQLSLEFRSGSEPIAFDVSVGGGACRLPALTRVDCGEE